MIELVMISLVVIVFVKASTNRTSNYLWGLVGLIYYIIGRIIFSILLYGVYKIFSNQEMEFRVYEGLLIIELLGGILFALLTAFVLGELSGLNIKKILKKE